MSTAAPLTVKDLCLFIEDYLTEKGDLFEYTKSNKVPQNELLEFNSNMKIFSAYLKKLPENEVLQDLSLEIYNSFQDFYVDPLHFKSKNFSIISLRIKEKIREEKISESTEMMFKYVKYVGKNIDSALDHYLKVAECFHNVNPNGKSFYDEGSIASKLDELIKSLFGYYEIKDSKGDICTTSFIALAAPSLVGKTQLAFLSKHQPLYFAMSQTGSNDFSQKIYLNYRSLNETLKLCAEKDLKIIDEIVSLGDLSRFTNYELISAGSLESIAFDTKLFVLGLLLALILDAGENYDCSSMKWMRYHAERRDMKIEAVSIKEFRQKLAENPDLFRKFVVFLDEFYETLSDVYTRNVIRACGLVCIVANTNTSVAKLVGNMTFRGSRQEAPVVWSFVLPEVDCTNRTILNSSLKIDLLIEEIISKMHPSQGEILKRYLDDVLDNQSKHIRPGILVFLYDSLNLLNSEPNLRSFQAGDCIDFIFRGVNNLLTFKKTSIKSEHWGQAANFALHTSSAFNFKIDCNYDSNLNSFLKYHLYYAVNPVCHGDWMFKLYLNPNKEFLSIRTGALTKWDESSFFKRGEQFTVISCLFGGIVYPVARFLSENNREAAKSPRLITDPNPNAKEKPGNALEVFTTVSVVDSSHYDCINRNARVFSLKGVDFKMFLSNLVRNCLNVDFWGETNKEFELELNFVYSMHSNGFELERYIESFHVPFLYSANMKWDKIFMELFPLSDARSTLKLGTYERPPNADRIDGRFDILNKDTNELCNGLVECKNLKGLLCAEKLNDILKKAVLPDSPFEFIYCNELGGISLETIGKNHSKICDLLNYAHKNEMNIFRLARSSQSTFKFDIIPYRKEHVLTSNPRLTVFILPITDIN